MSSTSSSDENQRLKEAVDSTLFPSDIYHSRRTSNETKEKTAQQPPSLRNKEESFFAFNPFNIKVTPQFQSYVAQQLRRKLDNVIDDKEDLPQHKKMRQKNQSAGVKLLRTSNCYLKVENKNLTLYNDNNKNNNVECKRIIDDESSSDSVYEKRAKDVAVSSDWVLSGKETEHWAPNTRGEVEVIKIIKKKKKKRQKQGQQ